MKGDFTRDTFDQTKQFTRVLMQQGRVQLDAEFNEQTAILLHYLRALASDMIGPHAGPAGNVGFQIGVKSGKGHVVEDLTISSGRYYVDGIMCEHVAGDAKSAPTYYSQPFYPLEKAKDRSLEPPFLVYLDVWERHVSAYEDDDIREIALGVNGPDTTTRAQVVWQVRTMPVAAITGRDDLEANWPTLVKGWQADNRGFLQARVRKADEANLNGPCVTPPDSRYRGAENQLYRVEVHRGSGASEPTFKWSRENGSTVFPVENFDGEGSAVTLASVGRDARLGLNEGDWVELMNNDSALRAEDPGPLFRVVAIDRLDRKVTLDRPLSGSIETDLGKRPLLRRWDNSWQGTWDSTNRDPADGLPILEDAEWRELEDGIVVRFQAGSGEANRYRTGDFWLIPARTVTGGIIWPGWDTNNPASRPPHGVQHHYAPLAIVATNNNKVEATDCRMQFDRQAVPFGG